MLSSGLLDYPYSISINEGSLTEVDEWRNAKDTEKTEWAFRRYCIEKWRQKLTESREGGEKKESETKTKELRRSNKREYVQVENSRILTSA